MVGVFVSNILVKYIIELLAERAKYKPTFAVRRRYSLTTLIYLILCIDLSAIVRINSP